MKELETTHIPVQFLLADDIEMTPFIKELSDSIKEKGLLNPITVQAVNTNLDEPRFKIVAGKKRLRALVELGVVSVPCCITTGDPTEIKLTTIEENLRRKNLEWWELAELVSEWHALRQEQLGKSAPTKGKEKRERPGWSMRDTAEELRISLGFVSEAVMLDAAVKRDPGLRAIKDRDTAVRLVRSAVKRIEAEVNAEAPVDFAVNQIYNGASADILKQFERHSFDACITDPPWLKYIDEKLTRDDETVPVFSEVYRVLRPDSFLYMFVGFEDFYSYLKKLPQLGFSVSKTPLLWIKKELRVHPAVSSTETGLGEPTAYLHGQLFSKGARAWEYSRDFELILLAVKGSPALVESVQQSSIKICPPLPPVKLTHPNEKPTELIRMLLDDCTHEGSIVLDPFAGSGSTPDACKETGRRYIAIERDRTFYEQIKTRLRKT